MTFDQVLPALKAGRAITRAHWLIPASFVRGIYLVKGRHLEPGNVPPILSTVATAGVEIRDHIDLFKMSPSSNLPGAQPMIELFCGWKGTAADLMADDWQEMPGT